MSKEEILTVLKFHNYVLSFHDFKKLLKYIQINDMYLGSSDSLKIKFSIDNEPIKNDILLIDIKFKEE